MGGGVQEAARRCRRLVEDRQVTDRIPGIVAAVVRDGAVAWSAGIGMARPDRPGDAPTTATRTNVASITKTFTAVLVAQLRDEGALALGDPVAAHLDVPAHGGLTVRHLLAHTGGLQREPPGTAWTTLEVPPLEALLAGLAGAEAVGPPDRRMHYSNLAYAVLGALVERLDGRPWAAALAARLLEPLGLDATSTDPGGDAATGLFVDPWADRVRPEPVMDWGGLDPAGGLWSSAADLARWAAFLAAPDPAVLAPATVDELCAPQVLREVAGWTLAHGLGVQLVRRGDRVLAGHGGGAPGFLSGLLVDRATGVGAVVLTTTGRGADPVGLAADLIAAQLDADPPARAPWRPGPPVPPEVEGVLGPWWTEGVAFVFRWSAGRLEAVAEGATAAAAPAVFTPEGPDRWRTASGREAGELLTVERDGAGVPVRLLWATYPCTRLPLAFADLPDTGSGGGPR